MTLPSIETTVNSIIILFCIFCLNFLELGLYAEAGEFNQPKTTHRVVSFLYVFIFLPYFKSYCLENHE